MKKIHLTALAASLAVLMGSAQAADAPTAHLYVKGTLDVPSCEVRPDDESGVYDYGDLGPEDIKPGSTYNTLATLPKVWTITCNGQTYLTFSVVDNATSKNVATGDEKFSLGDINGAGSIGYYTVKMKNATVDGNAARVFATTSTSITAVPDTDVKKNRFKMGWATAAGSQQIGSKFAANLDVTANLSGTSNMKGPITSDVDLAGSLTLNFAYGL